MSAEVIEVTGNIIVHHPVTVPTSSSPIAFSDRSTPTPSALSIKQLAALDAAEDFKEQAR